MKATVLTDFWKSNLSAGDIVTDSDYPEKILIRAADSGYLTIEPEEDEGMEDVER